MVPQSGSCSQLATSSTRLMQQKCPNRLVEGSLVLVLHVVLLWPRLVRKKIQMAHDATVPLYALVLVEIMALYSNQRFCVRYARRPPRVLM